MQMIFYSGGADGSDSIWEQKLKEKNQKIIVYRPYHINKLTNSEFNEIDKQYLEVVNILKRKPLSAERFAGLLVRRDMLQVNNANAVFAIGTINKYNGYVNGGTAYATTRAILLGIDVYLFEQDKKQWFKWNYNEKKFIEYNNKPKLLDKSTVIGTREINQDGVNAIVEIINRTFPN